MNLQLGTSIHRPMFTSGIDYHRPVAIWHGETGSLKRPLIFETVRLLIYTKIFTSAVYSKIRN
jgi:hypothetical protein